MDGIFIGASKWRQDSWGRLRAGRARFVPLLNVRPAQQNRGSSDMIEGWRWVS
jgi:hypothetical protein